MKWFARRDQGNWDRSRLTGIDLFCHLNDRELMIVDQLLHYRHYLKGEVVFDAQENGQALYFIVSGRVAICLEGAHEAPIARLDAKDFFGELGLLDDEPRTAQARALQPTELAVLFRGDFERLMDSHARIASKVAMQLAKHLGMRLRKMLQKEMAREKE